MVITMVTLKVISMVTPNCYCGYINKVIVTLNGHHHGYTNKSSPKLHLNVIIIMITFFYTTKLYRFNKNIIISRTRTIWKSWALLSVYITIYNKYFRHWHFLLPDQVSSIHSMMFNVINTVINIVVIIYGTTS